MPTHLSRLASVIVVIIIVRRPMRMGDFLMSMFVGVPFIETVSVET